MDLSRINCVLGDDITLCRLRYGYDRRRPPAEDGHGQVKVPVIQSSVIGRVQLVDQVVDGQNGRNAT